MVTLKNLQRVVMMAGGTGGHIFPGLAVARALQQQGVSIHWLGSTTGMENTLIPAANIPLTTLSIQGWRGKSWQQQCLAPWRLLQAIYQAWRFFRKIRPDLVIGMGGFAAGPGGIAAKLAKIPLIIHEQNRIAGMTNRYLAKIANNVLCTFPDTFPSHKKIHVTGNPVRADILQLPSPQQRFGQRQAPLNLFITGGSRGAAILNDILPKAIALLPPTLRPHIYHQTGQAQQASTQAAYEKLGITATVTAFVDDMATRYAWADVMISRAGASTVTEMMAVGIPAILVPFPHATDDHQTANARYLSEKNAAILLPQKELTAASLSRALEKLLSDDKARLEMAIQAYKMRQENTMEKILGVCASSTP